MLTTPPGISSHLLAFSPSRRTPTRQSRHDGTDFVTHALQQLDCGVLFGFRQARSASRQDVRESL